MEILRIEFQNFKSYGNKRVVIDFEKEFNNDLILLSGKNGNGKCLSSDTQIDIDFNQNDLIKNFNKQCTIGELYSFNKETNCINNGFIKVNTRFGYKKIEAIDITLKNSKSLIIKTQSDNLNIKPKIIRCSYEHQLYKYINTGYIYNDKHEIIKAIVNSNWFKVKDLNIGNRLLTIDGYETIIELIHYDINEDLYDLQVKDVKEFYANGIVSHNSTFKEIIEYSLFGKVEGFKLTDLPNRTNKALNTYIKFKSKTKLVEIERGIAPALFKLTINGKEYDEAGKRNIQQYIEDELFDIPYHVFKNIIVLSVNNFKSFLTMSPKDKRDIIDRIFGFDIINKMVEEIKNDKKDNERSFTMKTYEIDSIKQSIILLENKIANIKIENKDNQLDEIKIIKSNLILLEKELEKYDTLITSLNKSISVTRKKYDNQKDFIVTNKQKLIELNNKYKLYEHDRCPECESDLKTSGHIDKKEKIKQEMIIIRDEIVKKTSELNIINEKISTTENKYYNEIENKTKIDTKINQYKRSIIELAKNNNNETGDIKALKDMILDYENNLKTQEAKFNEIEKEKLFFNNVQKMLSDDGIKQVIFKNIIPLLNKNIKTILNNLDINFNVNIDTNFNCLVTSFGSEINVNTLSTGERTRVDIAIVISLIKIIKLQYTSLNVLFLDEIFSNIDLESIDNMIELIKNVSKELSMNTILVAHSPVTELLFDKKIILKKKNTFSELEIKTV